MRTILLDELKQIQLEILKVFSKYCEDNNLTYFLFGGTAIGAVRHHGYIPWDDDIDVAMPRADYEKLISKGHIEDMILLTPYGNSDYIYPFAKLVNPHTVIQERASVSTDFGIYIDIFPVDNISKIDISKYYGYRKICEFLMTCKMAESKKRALIKQITISICRILLRPISLNYIARKIDKHAKTISNRTEAFAGNLVWGYGSREVMDASVFSQLVDIQFEHYSFKIMKRYDEYLRNIYGDYMEYPPEEKRVLKHAFTAYWIEP